ncbi:hypothetical protein HDF10_001110 [Edaphobacter lichenicola]|uniref:Uncharacterized protein n=1 Tax=Tunturiibacter lichenicola TaxID=2051959 RepID=A0A7W8N4P9_9BACT|nr:hypothetical protein [Edaphobacter lichenicola]
MSAVWTSGVDVLKASFTPGIALVPSKAVWMSGVDVLVQRSGHVCIVARPAAPAVESHTCKHPFDDVQMDVEKGYHCKACDAPLVFCWVCANAGIYNMHVEPECDPGHKHAIYNSSRFE